MGNIKFDLSQLKSISVDKDVVFQEMEKFSSDMLKDRSSFFHLPEKTSWPEEIEKLQPVLAKRVPEIENFIHIGIGGSSLGPEAIIRALASDKSPNFYFLDSIDPDFLSSVFKQCNPQKSLVYVVSKSGGTYETVATFLMAYSWLEKTLGREEARKRLVFCTDPIDGDLRKLAKEWQLPCFEIPQNLGGRFSVLSAVGLLPSLVGGVDVKNLLKGAADYRKWFLGEFAEGKIPDVIELAFKLVELYKQGRPITVLMPYSYRLKTLSAWFTQLWAESLGKDGKGFTPLACTGPTDQHSVLQLLQEGPQDKVVGFVEIQGFDQMVDLKWTGPELRSFSNLSGITMNLLMDSELNATRDSLSLAKRPHFSVVLPKLSAHTLGQLFFSMQILTSIAGYALGVNPFDQPGVEQVKRITKERLAACKKSLLT